MTPQKIDRYEIKAELGRGGMATVYRAYDPRFKREVAIKVLPREFLHDPSFRARFEREAEMIAALEHPAIVPVYDYGEDEQAGQPYLVMRLMAGGSLADRLDNGPLSLAEAARLFNRLAPALDRAHSKGVVHRDLKPGNILFDEEGNPYISDFGLAKLAESNSSITGTGVLGTPAYMSPEQAQGEKDLDGRSDIYALGAILFQMLTGKIPYEADTPVGVIVKHITEPVPSILDSNPNLPVDCEELVQRAMAKEREKRFERASELAQTLRAIAGQFTSAAEALNTQAERLVETPATVNEAGRQPEARRITSSRWMTVAAGLGVIILIAATAALVFSRLPLSAVSPNTTLPPTTTLAATAPALAATSTLPPFTILSPDNAPSVSQLAQLGKGVINDIAWSPDGKTLALASPFNIYLYDGETLEEQASFATEAEIHTLHFGPDGNTLIGAHLYGNEMADTVWIWRLDGKTINTFTPGEDRSIEALSPDGRYLLTSGYPVQPYDVNTGQPLPALAEMTAEGVRVDVLNIDNPVFSADGNVLAAFCNSEGALLCAWDINTGQLLNSFEITPTNWPDPLLLSPDGRIIFERTAEAMILWNVKTGEQLSKMGFRPGAVAFSADGKLLTVLAKGTLRVFDTQTWEESGQFALPTSSLSELEFRPTESGYVLAGIAGAGAVEIWDVETGELLRTIEGYSTYVRSVAVGIVEGNYTVFSAGSNDIIQEWDFLSGEFPRTFEGRSNDLALSPDGKTLASASASETIWLWDTTTGEKISRGNKTSADVAISPDGQLLATADFDGEAILLDIKTGETLYTLKGDSGQPSLAFSPDGRMIALGSANSRLVRVWSLESGQLLQTVKGTKVSFAPGGQALVTSNYDGISFWDPITGKLLRALEDENSSYAFAISPDGKLLATGDETSIRLWDMANLQLVAELKGHRGGVPGLAFTPNGALLVSGGFDGTVRVWGIPVP